MDWNKRLIVVVVIVAAALVGCGRGDGGAAPANGASDFKSIAAPTREGVATRITGADNGKAVVVSVGTEISVELSGIPTAGYAWGLASAPDFLEPAGEAGGPTSEAQLQPGFAGGRHWEVFFFDVKAAGEGVLRFEQRRFWEETEPPNDEFSVTIKAE